MNGLVKNIIDRHFNKIPLVSPKLKSIYEGSPDNLFHIRSNEDQVSVRKPLNSLEGNAHAVEREQDLFSPDTITSLINGPQQKVNKGKKSGNKARKETELKITNTGSSAKNSLNQTHSAINLIDKTTKDVSPEDYKTPIKDKEDEKDREINKDQIDLMERSYGKHVLDGSLTDRQKKSILRKLAENKGPKAETYDYSSDRSPVRATRIEEKQPDPLSELPDAPLSEKRGIDEKRKWSDKLTDLIVNKENPVKQGKIHHSPEIENNINYKISGGDSLRRSGEIIRVNIGQIEIKAVNEEKPVTRKPVKEFHPRLSLSKYLESKNKAPG